MNKAQKYLISYGLGGGFGGAINHMVEVCYSDFDAERFAYEQAKECYESYEGMHGLLTVEEIQEENNVDEDDTYQLYTEEVENWLEYYFEIYDPEKHDDLLE